MIFLLEYDRKGGKLCKFKQFLDADRAQAQCHAVHGDFAEPAAFLGDFAPRSSTLPWRDVSSFFSVRQNRFNK